MLQYCLTLNLKDDPSLISEYEEYHKNVWPEIIQSIHDSGIISMTIFRFETRLVMIMNTKDDFSFEKKQKMDMKNSKVVEWEKLMLKFQQPLTGSQPGEKWIKMNKIFQCGI